MAQVVVSLDQLGVPTGDRDPNTVYWRAENHTAEGNSYLRVDQWMADIGDLVLGVGREHLRAVVPMTAPEGAAILRYVEELKMFANVEDCKRKPGDVPALHDPSFLDAHWRDEVLAQWPSSKVRGPWLQALRALEQKLQAAIAPTLPDGAFVKLSVRSPKDAVFDMQRLRDLIASKLAESKLPHDHPEALSEDIAAIRWASWQALRCRSGSEALELLLRSDRIYRDVLQHDLFTGGDPGKFDLQVHVSPFVEDFDPALEFRGFVANGKKTSLTAYSPWVYDKRIVANKDRIHDLITALWDKAAGRVRSENYSIDFALSPALDQCWCVELNNLLPPLAGCGLFNYHDAEDRAVLEGRRPYEFRIKSDPIVAARDFVQTHRDSATGVTRTVTMQPAPPHLVAFVDVLRKRPRVKQAASRDCSVM